MRARVAVLILVAASLAACVAPAKAAKYDPPDERFVLFTSASVDVANAEGFFSIGYVAAMLEEHPSWRVLVVGHADTSGASDKNRDLCFRRARSVRKVLLAHGVADARVTVAAPQGADSATAAMLSRRADVYLYDPQREDIGKRLGYPIDQKNE